MKNLLKITLSLLFIAASFTSCVDDKDFDTPQVACDDTFTSNIPVSKITSFENVYNKYVDGFNTFSDEEVYFVGYVTSSDLNGNFYKELFIQDNIENPSYALKLDINIRGMYAKYPVGSKLYILLSGLGIDKSHGIITLGENMNETLGKIRENVAKSHIFRTCSQENIIATEITSATEIDDSFIGKYVKLTGTQFDYSLFNNGVGVPFIDPNADYSTFRDVIFCVDNSVIKMDVSPYVKFADIALPYQKFDISGVLTRDYNDDFYVLKINSVDDIITNNTDRCDPNFLDCGNNAVGGSVIVYEETFESYGDDQTSFGNWTNTNVNGGAKLFVTDSYNGNRFVGGSAYNSNENPLEMWLVTEGIDMDNTTDEELTFKTQAHHSDGSVTLSVYVSTDYTGDVATATWSLVQANIGTTSSTYGDWTNSGSINVSCLDGTVYLAFKYEGRDESGSDPTTGMNIDDIKITGN